MGNSQSEQSQEVESTSQISLSPPVGYRVLGVQSQSPASYTDLVAHFDFIVAANNVPLQTLDTTFIEIIRASDEKPLTLTIYNTKNHTLREVVIVPTRNWPGEGMLGATIRFDSFQDCDDQVIRVTDIEANSPADIAGLKPISDFILGTLEKVFKDVDTLFSELKNNIDRPMEIFVYNSETDTVRITVIMPTEDWGGEGILGAGVAHGILHRIPKASSLTIGKSADHGYAHSEVPEPTTQPAVASPSMPVEEVC